MRALSLVGSLALLLFATPALAIQVTVTKYSNDPGYTEGVTVGAADVGLYCGSQCSSATSVANGNNQITIIAKSAANWHFDGWTGACAGQGFICTLTGTAGARYSTVAVISKRTSLPTCSNTSQVITDSPIQLQYVTSVHPLGLTDPYSGHVLPSDHWYMNIYHAPGALPSVGVYPSASGYVTRVYWDANNNGAGQNYNVFLQPCTGVQIYLDHLHALSGGLSTAFEAGKRCYYDASGNPTTCYWEPSGAGYWVDRSTVIGLAGHINAVLDYGVADTSLALYMHTPTLYEPDRLHDACPLNYMATTLRTNVSPILTPSYYCGTVFQDQSTSIRGNWIRVGTTRGFSESAFLTLLNDETSPDTRNVISISDSASPLPVGRYSFAVVNDGTGKNRDFRSILTDDYSVHCFGAFETPAGPSVFLLQLDASTGHLFVQRSSSGTCADSYSSIIQQPDSVEYQR